MPRMQIKLLILTLAAMLLVHSGCSVANEPSEGSKNAAPDFTLKNLNGEEVTLSNVLRDKKVVLDFWATWCPHCVTTAPQLERFYKKNKGKTAVFGINVEFLDACQGSEYKSFFAIKETKSKEIDP